MDHTVKWVLAPSEKLEGSCSQEDLMLSLSLFSKNLINVEGKLLSKDKTSYIRDSCVFDCLVKKKHAKHFSRFLELKTQLKENPLKRKKSKWDMNDE